MRKKEYATLALHSCVLLLLLGLVLGFRQHEVYTHDRDKQDATIDRNLALIQARSDSYFERLVLEAEFIARSPILRMYLEHPSPEKLAPAEEALLLLSSMRPYLDQVRYIDQQGMERIRVNQQGGSPRLAKELQDKSDRDYVQAGLALNAGGVYISEIDLNIEHDQIERPFRPMLRVVFKATVNGRAAGMIVLNAKADEIGEEFQMIMPTKDQQLVALNSDGGWIMGGGTKDWLFAAEPAAQEARLSVEAPALWAQIQASPSGQFEYQGQCHYYRWYQFKQREKQSPRLLVAQRFQDQDCGYMANSAVKTWATQLALTSAFALPLLLLWNLSRARERELRHQLLQSNVQLDLVTREADLGLIMVDHQCRVCWANPEAKRFLGWKAADLIGENLHKRIHINRLLNFSPTPSAIGC